MINSLDLFAGIGGMTLALEGIAKPVAYCECDRYAQCVLRSRMADGELPSAPIIDDVRSINKETIKETIDIMCAGFPCQDISVAGCGAGLEGKRSGLFFEIVRLCRDIRPRFVFLENVPAITTRGLDRVTMEFTALGYDCRWTIVSARELGAPHIRKRWFILAHADSSKLREQPRRGAGKNGEDSLQFRNEGTNESVANAMCTRLERENRRQPRQSKPSRSSQWEIEPSICRVVDGIPFRAHRIKCLGNAVIPLQARTAFERLIGMESEGVDERANNIL